MNKMGFSKLSLGFLFIMLSFRIQGIDILPDIIGYLFFASGFKDLSSGSTYFTKASKYNLPMIIVSVFSIYQSPAQGGGIHLGPLGIFSIPIAIAGFVLNLYVVYNLFLGTKEMAEKVQQFTLASESEKKWNQYKLLQIGMLVSFILIFIPSIAFMYIIVLFVIAIILLIGIMGFMKRCGEILENL